MSVSLARAKGVTVMTLTSDPKSRWPPLCQILCGLCYSPVCCSVSQHLRTVMGRSQSALGALQIMVGLLHIGLGVILLCSGPGSWWQMDETAFPEWLGGLFIVFGVVCILSERYPSPCLVIVNVMLNLSGIAFAIAAIVLYSSNMAHIWLWRFCEDEYDYYWRTRPTPNPTMSVREDFMKDRCMTGKRLVLMLLRGINGVLIVLSVLELCFAISASVLAIKALRRRDKKSLDDPETYKPLLEEDKPSA
ncbi:transmembrane protein 176B-like isoform X2 [Dunckerocampus dactyliophorus]|nr:transmembrane protein 176B-like isoform X2 [Dunckerocampus dactyliophorus]XP_054630475.1 transmembrane protein 176B-like isoform X2 [Dunckerocampus dactyliophorus]XP_054630476.1 transmembrane protein 176B-like isoform X2 [Dunckerocampus dactyliophorus]